MLAILSPAKNFQQIPFPAGSPMMTKPRFLEKTTQLIEQMQKYFPDELSDLMNMSSRLGEENYIRFQNFLDATECGHAALLSYKGEAFKGVGAESFSEEDLCYAQQTIRILSGLYGVLCPLDEIKPYRVEMQTQFHSGTVRSLYHFWRADLTNAIKEAVQASPGDFALIHVASQEYAKALDLKTLKVHFPVIQIHFKEEKEGKLRVVSTYAKRARGLFIRYLVQNRVHHISELQNFVADGYSFCPDLSTKTDYLFIR